MDNRTIPPSSTPLPPLLCAVDWHAVPQRSVLQAVTRAARSGWRPGADTLAEIIAYATRALSGHDRLAHRGREALAALSVTQPSSADDRPADANVASVGQHCPVCHGDQIIPGPRADLLRCAGCRSLLVQQASGQLREWLRWQEAGSKARRANRHQRKAVKRGR